MHVHVFIRSALYGLIFMAVSPAAIVVESDPPPGPSAVTVGVGPLTFSNFWVVNAGARAPVTINLVSTDFIADTAYLNFNPGMLALAGETQDVWLYFDVNASAGYLIDSVDLQVGGSNSAVTERVCAGFVDINAGNSCRGGPQLAVLADVSGQSNITSITPSAHAAIFKDLLADGRINGPAEFTSFTQSFHVSSAVPEPATNAMIGSGMIALVAWVRRRRQ
jgi:hypothetical protein